MIGLNPSTATRDKSDTTVAKVEAVARRNGHDGFVMLNLYPLRATKPSTLPQRANATQLRRNLDASGCSWRPARMNWWRGCAAIGRAGGVTARQPPKVIRDIRRGSVTVGTLPRSGRTPMRSGLPKDSCR